VTACPFLDLPSKDLPVFSLRAAKRFTCYSCMMNSLYSVPPGMRCLCREIGPKLPSHRTRTHSDSHFDSPYSDPSSTRTLTSTSPSNSRHFRTYSRSYVLLTFSHPLLFPLLLPPLLPLLLSHPLLLFFPALTPTQTSTPIHPYSLTHSNSRSTDHLCISCCTSAPFGQARERPRSVALFVDTILSSHFHSHSRCHSNFRS
jgi:hypothetical protein